MKVVITGGTGLIGSALARSLAQDGHDTVILTRDASQKAPQLPTSARLVEWDAQSGEGWSSEAEGARAIVNLAGATLGPEGGLWTASRKRTIMQSRVGATEAVIDAIRRVDEKPAVLIQGSAIGYYGTHEDELIVEGAPPGNDFLAEVVQTWEATSDPATELGVRRVCARTGVVLAREGGSLSLLALPVKLFVGGPLGSGRQYLSWVHLDDVVAAIRFLIDRDDADGAFNLTAPNPVPQKEFSQIMGKVLNRPSFIPTPGFALKLALGEMSIIALEGQRVLPHRLQQLGYDFQFPNLEGALRDVLK